MASIIERVAERVRSGWNAFVADDRDNVKFDPEYGGSFSNRPDRVRMTFSNERSIIASIYNRLAIDATSEIIRHVRLDDNDNFLEDIKSGLNYCLTVEANLDQAASMFRRDMFLSMFDQGVVALVPIDTDINPDLYGNYDIRTMRVGVIKQWYKFHVQVSVWDVNMGRKRDLRIPKTRVAIVENPLFTIMNEPNSTLQRLIRKLNLLDAIDEQSASGKLDVIIQLPYVIKSESRRASAKQRQLELEQQLKGSKYGVGYIDATEKITQLNRPAENNLLKQVEYLTGELYGQMGLTPAVFNGTASEAEMLNYHNRTIDPILDAFTEEIGRKFLTRTARTQKQAIKYYRNPFKYMSVKDFAEVADKLIRNELAAANELRGVIGWRPSKDPKADELRNPNVPAPVEETPAIEAPKSSEPIELTQIK